MGRWGPAILVAAGISPCPSVAQAQHDHAAHAAEGRWTIYSRAELVDRFILVDFDYAAQFGLERHLRSQVAAWTLGYERRLHTTTRTDVALGADLTLHRTPANLRDAYGHPVSWHVFARLALR